MALFSPSGVLRGFPAATYVEYAFMSRFAGAETLVRPCSTKKMLISDLDTQWDLHDSWMDTISYLKIIFWPNLGVGPRFKSSTYLSMPAG